MGGVDGDFLFLRYMCHRGAFREDIFEKCVFCKTEDNGIEHVTNNCMKFKKVREELIDKLNKLDAIRFRFGSSGVKRLKHLLW